MDASNNPQQTVVPGDPFYRIWASVVDGFYIGLVSVTIAILFLRSGFAQPILEYSSIIIYFIYVTFLTVIKGATIGKEAYGMTVVSYGTQNRISYGQAIVRELVKSGVAYIPVVGAFLFIVNTCVMVFSKDKRGIHDKIARTQVVKVKPAWSLKKQLLFIVVPFVILMLLSAYFYAQPTSLPPVRHHN